MYREKCSSGHEKIDETRLLCYHIAMDISEKLISLRKACSLSQEDFAARVGVARQTVVSWEQGARPSAFNRRRICEEFSLPVNYFDADVNVTLLPVVAAPVKAEEAEEEHAPGVVRVISRPASDALRSLGTVMRWGNVFFAGLLLFGAFVGTVLCIVSLFAAPSGADVQLLVNKRDILYLTLGLLGVVAVFYAVCFFVRLLLRELLRIKARRK